MVMQEEGINEQPEQLNFVDMTPEQPLPQDATTETPVENQEEQPVATETTTENVVEEPIQQVPVPESPPEKSREQIQEEAKREAEFNELHQRRLQEQETARRQSLAQKAQNYEKQLQDQGLLPDIARQQTRQMLQYENKLYEQDKQSYELLAYAEGRNIAALQIGVEHGLIPKEVVNDINVLLQAQSPAAMKYEAARMKELRQTRAENTRLKQGQVPPQTFDNSQGSAEAVTSQDRLIDAYLNGDRSEAAVQAAKRLTFGS